MSGGRNRDTPRARHVTGENDDAARPAQHAAPIAKPTTPVVREVPRDSVPPSQRPGRPGNSLSPRDVQARIAAGWAAKAKRDDEEAREGGQEEGEA